ncbi:hypothetical protein EO95_17470 [Methanosarcina sp. 1.H.T.1A.1]|nr:hypothetical protein EO95_17470 [Methanosarcina sp. 1.H.T.1A.1]
MNFFKISVKPTFKPAFKTAFEPAFKPAFFTLNFLNVSFCIFTDPNFLAFTVNHLNSALCYQFQVHEAHKQTHKCSQFLPIPVPGDVNLKEFFRKIPGLRETVNSKKGVRVCRRSKVGKVIRIDLKVNKINLKVDRMD